MILNKWRQAYIKNELSSFSNVSESVWIYTNPVWHAAPLVKKMHLGASVPQRALGIVLTYKW